MSESKEEKRAKFLAWAAECGDPGGNVLAGGPPVTHSALKSARQSLEGQQPTEKQVFAEAAKIDSKMREMIEKMKKSLPKSKIWMAQQIGSSRCNFTPNYKNLIIVDGSHLLSKNTKEDK